MARERIAQADVEIARQQLGLRVIQAWSDAVGAHLKVQAHRRSQRTHVQLLALVERRMSEGASARADADLAWARLELVRADLVAAQSQLDIALQRLSALVGVPTLEASSLPQATQLTAPPVGERNADAALSRALALSPQFAKAQAQKQLAQAEVESARAARWPELELRLERQFGDATGSGAAQQNRVWLGLNSSLGAGLSVGARVEEALAQLQSASDEVNAQQLALDEQIRNDLVHAVVAQERRAYLR